MARPQDEGAAPTTLLGRYTERRRLADGVRRGDAMLVALDSDPHRLVASFRPVGPRGQFLLIGVRSDQRLSADVSRDVQASCNLWNSRMRLPRAWWDRAPEAFDGQVVLDGCAPFGAVRAQPAFDALADAVIAGSRRFWRWVDAQATW